MSYPSFFISEVFRFSFSTYKKHFGLLLGLSFAIWAIGAFGTFLKGIFLTQAIENDSLFFSWLSLSVTILTIVIQMTVGLGWAKACLKFVDGQEGQLSDLSSSFPLVPRFFGAFLLLGLMMVGIAFLGCAVAYALLYFLGPGLNFSETIYRFQSGSGILRLQQIISILLIYAIIFFSILLIAIKYAFFGYVLVDKEVSAGQSLQISALITQGSRGKIFLLYLCLSGLSFLALLPMFVYALRMVSDMTVLSQMMLQSLLSLIMVVLAPMIALSLAYTYRQLESRFTEQNM